MTATPPSGEQTRASSRHACGGSAQCSSVSRHSAVPTLPSAKLRSRRSSMRSTPGPSRMSVPVNGRPANSRRRSPAPLPGSVRYEPNSTTGSRMATTRWRSATKSAIRVCAMAARSMAAPMQESRRVARADAYENPRAELQRHVPIGARRVLDLGCASGALGAALRARGAYVIGVERDPAYAAAARERLDEVVEADLETLEPAALGRFDVLIAGDVLEHLVDPWTVLARLAHVVEPGGVAIVSLPNVRHWEALFAIGVQGR